MGIFERYFMSDDSPILAFIFHFVPFDKSFSEIHDIETAWKQMLDKISGFELDELYPILSIPSSFMSSLLAFPSVILDYENIPDNFITIYKTYGDRTKGEVKAHEGSEFESFYKAYYAYKDYKAGSAYNLDEFTIFHEAHKEYSTSNKTYEAEKFKIFYEAYKLRSTSTNP